MIVRLALIVRYYWPLGERLYGSDVLLAGMVLWLNYHAATGNSFCRWWVQETIESQVITNIFATASCLKSLPTCTPKEIKVIDGPHSMPVLCTVIIMWGSIHKIDRCLCGGQNWKLRRTVHSGRMYFGSMRRMIANLERVHLQMSAPSQHSACEPVSNRPNCWQLFVVLCCI